ncbi:MAG: hypothetical protein M3R52_00030 [Acidobacteriota bacterium]|nr:hypothetical protein [Acidobacteriota bacterium]
MRKIKIPFELLLKKAQDQTKTVSVTMSNGKVYVGWVTHLFNPALPTNFIQILPVKSGYRDEETKWVVFTTFYSEALDNLKRGVDATYSEYVKAVEELERLTSENEEKKTTENENKIRKTKDYIEQLELDYYEMETTADDFDIVLPVSEIMSINIFSEYVHSEHFAPPKDEATETDANEDIASNPDDEEKLRILQDNYRYIQQLNASEREKYFDLLQATMEGSGIDSENKLRTFQQNLRSVQQLDAFGRKKYLEWLHTRMEGSGKVTGNQAASSEEPLQKSDDLPKN